MEPDVTNDTPGPTLADPLAEAVRLVQLADARGLQVRLMGGLAFHARVRDWTAEARGRDIDLATRSKDRRALGELMSAEGYTADRRYNALYGHKQLYFVDELRTRPVDVLVDRLEMCHTFEFVDRLAVAEVTVPPAELLLSKLQVVKINRKDVLDALALLSELPLADGDDGGRAISLKRITSFTSGDWGWWRTVTGNLTKLNEIEQPSRAGRAGFRAGAAVRCCGPGRGVARRDRRGAEIDEVEDAVAGRRPDRVVRGA